MPEANTVLTLMGLGLAWLFGYWWGRQSGWDAAWREALKRMPAVKPRTPEGGASPVKSSGRSAAE